jgi:hypothetical protein
LVGDSKACALSFLIVYIQKYIGNKQLVSMIIYNKNMKIIEGPGGLKWMFLTFGDVMVNDSFIAAESFSSGFEVVEIFIDSYIRQHASCSEIYNCTTYSKQTNHAF